ncbi:MAG: pyruvate dehydrogenase (acetyl-transferring) E1 component subunit alpha [Leptospiraceae bacterium]|nr:pyruvate dehydrogenase (acetyl-transferring) E1 component subunit alpha [Leptospiraceae bacterium]MCP5501471.1 pyruvate dehydrogenase (acetyl-transferring) E1 component subunit alpha [Leptospiraceae bacterium]
MLLIRRFEEAAAKAYASGKIGGFCHLYIGQEAVAVGSIATLEEKDSVVSTYRDHGHALARGLSAKALMAELFGKKTGISKGYGGSMHFFDKEKNFLGGHGIVGGHISLAAGVAFADKYQGNQAVTLCFFGDGAANIGSFHEGLNLAAIWKLPVVFICENNHYAMGTHEYRAISVKDVSIRATAYNIARDHIEADEVRKIRNHVKVAVDRARRGEGPTLIEISTYRFRGHSMSDPAKYRTKEEVDEYKRRDPLVRAENELLAYGLDKKDLEAIEERVNSIVDESVEFAQTSEEPPLSWLHQHVYVD